MKAYLLFEDTPSPVLRYLKPDYRHVSVIVETGDHYVHVNPVKSGIKLRVINQEQVDKMYDNTVWHDIAIVQTDVIPHIPKIRLWSVLSCVEVTKSILGIRAWWIVTPYQLYKYINKPTGE